MIVKCPYCNNPANLVDSSVIYGKSYGLIYLCQKCDAYVGTHKHDNKPLGTLANHELRQWRNKAHKAFDPLWRNSVMSRSQAYKWLVKSMDIPATQAHIAMFDIQQCQKVINLCNQLNENLKVTEPTNSVNVVSVVW